MTAFLYWRHFQLPTELFDLRLAVSLASFEGALTPPCDSDQHPKPLRGLKRPGYLAAQDLSHFHPIETASLRLAIALLRALQSISSRPLDKRGVLQPYEDVRCLWFHSLLRNDMPHVRCLSLAGTQLNFKTSGLRAIPLPIILQSNP